MFQVAVDRDNHPPPPICWFRIFNHEKTDSRIGDLRKLLHDIGNICHDFSLYRAHAAVRSLHEFRERAIISDIHSGIEALEAVLADISQQKISEIYCLGDIIGYGPNPRECIDLVMATCKVTLLGNHDQAVLGDFEDFDESNDRGDLRTRKLFESDSGMNAERRRAFLRNLPFVHREPNFLFVHGSARDPVNECVFPEDIYNPRKMEQIFSQVEKYCFQGHTHIPGVFTEDLRFLTPEEIDFQFELGEKKMLVNVGSVGQPRNSDNRSSYVVIDANMIHFRRVEFDYEKTWRKM